VAEGDFFFLRRHRGTDRFFFIFFPILALRFCSSLRSGAPVKFYKMGDFFADREQFLPGPSSRGAPGFIMVFRARPLGDRDQDGGFQLSCILTNERRCYMFGDNNFSGST